MKRMRLPRNSALAMVVLFLAGTAGSHAATFHVSGTTGDDSRAAADAQNVGTPWKTIQRAADVMEDGDTCLIRAGTYRETVKPKTGQTFANYDGEMVVVSGCDIVSPDDWSLHHGNIYKANIDDAVYDVFVDGQYMDKARWPDADGDVMRKKEWVPTTNGGRRNAGWVEFDQQLPADFVGGFYTGHNGKNAFNFNHGRISGQDGKRISVTHLNFRWWQGVPGHIGWGSLVTLLGSNSTVANNHIESANWITRQHTANITVSGTNQKILNNTLRDCTGKMIAFIIYDGDPVKGITIRGNDCRKYAYAMFDGGTACFYTNGEDDLGGAEISHNVIAENMTLNDRVSCGIYLDDGAHNAVIHHNVIHGGGHCRSGIFTHKGNQKIRVYHNSVWAVTNCAWLSSVWEGTRDAATMVYRNNHSGGAGYRQNGVPGTITQDHNRQQVPGAELADVAKMDFRIRNAKSASIDAGQPIDGINEGHAGDRPDLGAYEYGGGDWKAGATVKPD